MGIKRLSPPYKNQKPYDIFIKMDNHSLYFCHFNHYMIDKLFERNLIDGYFYNKYN